MDQDSQDHHAAAGQDQVDAGLLDSDPGDVELGEVLLGADPAVGELAVHAHGHEEQHREVDEEAEEPEGDVAEGPLLEDGPAGVAGHRELDQEDEADLEVGQHL